MTVTKITVLLAQSDELCLHTDLPDGMWPYTDHACLKMNVVAGRGEEYVKHHFPNIPYEVINVKR